MALQDLISALVDQLPETSMSALLSQFAAAAQTESAFEVLAVAKRLIANGKDVIELEIGDSPFASSPSALPAARQALEKGHCRYAPSAGILELRSAAADYVNAEYGFDVSEKNILVGPGAKNFEQLFCETFVDPGDAVLVFTPHFPTYPPNIHRRGGRIIYSRLRQDQGFRPNLDEIRKFVREQPKAKAIILNSPHNPTGGVATQEDLQSIADVIRGRNIALLSDEPYDRMAWNEPHGSIAAIPGMLSQCVAAYTFSKSFSMSGWRLGFAVTDAAIVDTMTKLTNTAISCVSPFTQLAGAAVLNNDVEFRDKCAATFRERLQTFTSQLDQIEGISCDMPAGTFYAFANVEAICKRHNITSHKFAKFLLEDADEKTGVACLGGECFGQAGQGFLRFSVAQPPERLQQAVDFIADTVRNRMTGWG